MEPGASMVCQSSPHSSLGWGVRSEPLPQRRSVAGQYRSQPQHRRSGWGGLLGNFLAMVSLAAWRECPASMACGGGAQGGKRSECGPGLVCVKPCRSAKSRAPALRCTCMCGSSGACFMSPTHRAGWRRSPCRPGQRPAWLSVLRRQSARRGWSACRRPAIAASGPGS